MLQATLFLINCDHSGCDEVLWIHPSDRSRWRIESRELGWEVYGITTHCPKHRVYH